MEPGKIAYFHLELDHTPGACTIDIERDTEPVTAADYLAPLAYIHTGPPRIRATLSGTCVSQAADYQPPARATHVAVLDPAPHALPAAPKDTA